MAAELTRAPEGEALAEAERERALARLQAAETVRVAREQAFGSLLGRIRDELAALRGSDAYPAVFEALLAESRAALPQGRELRVDRRDADLAASLAGDLQVVTTLDTWGGVELAGDDGRTIRNTLEERLVNADQLLRGRFAHWLDTGTRGGSGGRAMTGVRRADFDYGNTRLRARRGAFLSGATYERLLGEDIDGVLRALAGHPLCAAGRGGRRTSADSKRCT